MSAVFALENPVFRTFIGYAGLVLTKTIVMSVITSYHRITKKVFINPEDAAHYSKKLQTVQNHPGVERVRRCHLNDLENVIPFVLIGLLYVATEPSQWAATLHFRIFTISRFLHTFAYLFAIRQPSRALTFAVGFAVNISMICRLITSASF